MNEILLSREWRSNLIGELKNQYKQNSILVIKANIAGLSKQISEAYIIINVFFKVINRKYSIINSLYFDSVDGPFHILVIDYNFINLKNQLIELETKHPLGRLVDLDVYKYADYISRESLGQKMRKCLICYRDAHHCIRSKSHKLDEVIIKTKTIVRDYVKLIVFHIIDEAITLEASLDPKFGLVTKYSNGSHLDMDFDLLMRSKEAIIDDLVEMFFLGYDNHYDLAFKKARELGLSTEQKMFAVTNNINTYKGLIFVLGIALVALGYCLNNNRKDLYSVVKLIGRDLLSEYNYDLNTFGSFAHKQYKFTGARGEVFNGLPNVKNAINYLNDFNNESLTITLIKLISEVEDTVLLKRCKTIEKYNYYKNLIGSIEKYDIDNIKNITNICIKNNISFGGSADLLVVCITIKKFQELFGVNYE